MENLKESPGHFNLWRELELHEFEDKYVFKSVESSDRGFSVSRFDGNIEILNGEVSTGAPPNGKVSRIYGVVGTIRLLAGAHILVITSRKEVGNFVGFPVFRVVSMKFLSCNDASKQLTSGEKKDESYFMTLLRIVESTPGLYYSYETDITLNLQRRFRLANGWMSKPLWKQADPRFVWNRNMMEELIENKLDGFIIPLLQGSFQTGELKLKGSPATVTLISRRCNRRLGTRMWRRGANLEGDAANFTETEQVLEFEGLTFSFLQECVEALKNTESFKNMEDVRGSIPLLWEQIVDLSYKPRLNIINHEQTVFPQSTSSSHYQHNPSKVVECHFLDLTQRYGDVVAVDLTDKHGDEGLLSNAYATEMQKLSNVSYFFANQVQKESKSNCGSHPQGVSYYRYISFDFHQTCGRSNLDNIQLLYDQISEDVEKHGYFLLSKEGEILSEQNGVIRSNCIDCLDRTNVTQSFLARKYLDCQLQRASALSSTDCISMFSEDFETFKTLWVDQGDEISLEYSGTHALKRDLVRYGKQTMAGLIKDGMSAILRYYLNNFHDGVRQDAIDLVSGRYVINTSWPSTQHNGFESFSYLPVASALLIGGLTVTTITLNQAGRNAQQFLSSVLCVGLSAGLMAVVKSNGRQICSRPRLCGLL